MQEGRGWNKTISERKWYEKSMRKCVCVCYVNPRWGLLSWIEVSPGGWLLQLSRSFHTCLSLSLFFFPNIQPVGVGEIRKVETNKREQWRKCGGGKGHDVIGTNDKEEKILYVQIHFSISVCSLGKCKHLERYDLFVSVLRFAFDLFVSAHNSSHWAQSRHTNVSRYWTSVRLTPTTHTNTPTWGTVVDNSLYSRPDASMGIDVFQAETAELVLWSLSDCWLKMGFTVPHLDLCYCCGNPSSDPRSVLKTDFTPLSCCKNRKQTVGAQIWCNTAL